MELEYFVLLIKEQKIKEGASKGVLLGTLPF
jgi:hypothetical protein